MNSRPAARRLLGAVCLGGLIFAAAAFWAATVHAQAPSFARVTRVVDGDTVWLRTPERARIKARLHGIDAPESCQVGGQQASDWLRQRIDQRVVSVTWKGRDSYGRALVRLALDGRDLGADMVAQGWAWSYGWREQRSGYEGLQAEAQRARRGVFALGHAQRPRDFRRQHGPCR